jgi:hypothetical protein
MAARSGREPGGIHGLLGFFGLPTASNSWLLTPGFTTRTRVGTPLPPYQRVYAQNNICIIYFLNQGANLVLTAIISSHIAQYGSKLKTAYFFYRLVSNHQFSPFQGYKYQHFQFIHNF